MQTQTVISPRLKNVSRGQGNNSYYYLGHGYALVKSQLGANPKR